MTASNKSKKQQPSDTLLPAIKAYFMNIINSCKHDETGYYDGTALLKTLSEGASEDERELSLKRFMALKRTKELVKQLETKDVFTVSGESQAQSTLQATNKAVIKTRNKAGQAGETLLHPVLFLELGRWANADLHKVLLEVCAAWVSADVNLTSDLIERTNKKEDQQQLYFRLRGKLARTEIEDAILFAGATNWGSVTDEVYLAIFGKRAAQLKDELGLSDSKALRDSFTSADLSRVETIEREAALSIRKQNARGNSKVLAITKEVAAKLVASFKALDSVSTTQPKLVTNQVGVFF